VGTFASPIVSCTAYVPIGTAEVAVITTTPVAGVGEGWGVQLNPGIALPEASGATLQAMTATGSLKPFRAVEVRLIAVGLKGSVRFVFAVVDVPCVRVIWPGVIEDEKFCTVCVMGELVLPLKLASPA
jgi:hypothetical protein